MCHVLVEESFDTILYRLWGGGGVLGVHTTVRILSLLRYVVDIGKSSPNPIFFLNPMKTDQREAYQSSKFGLFHVFVPPLEKLQTPLLIWLKLMFLLLNRNNNFGDKKV